MMTIWQRIFPVWIHLRTRMATSGLDRTLSSSVCWQHALLVGSSFPDARDGLACAVGSTSFYLGRGFLLLSPWLLDHAYARTPLTFLQTYVCMLYCHSIFFIVIAAGLYVLQWMSAAFAPTSSQPNFFHFSIVPRCCAGDCLWGFGGESGDANIVGWSHADCHEERDRPSKRPRSFPATGSWALSSIRSLFVYSYMMYMFISFCGLVECCLAHDPMFVQPSLPLDLELSTLMNTISARGDRHMYSNDTDTYL